MAHGFTDNKETADLDTYINNAVSGLAAQINTLQNTINTYWQKIYPVGSIYTTVSTTSPATLFGGTWERYGVGRTLVGVDATQSEFNSVNKTGGAKTVTLTPAQMPAHNHISVTDQNDALWSWSGGFQSGSGTRGALAPVDSGRAYTGNTGGNQAHNNLQPYITVYFWRRTA